MRELGKGKPVALLAFLSASPGRRASRERLASLLWSEGSTEQARQNLRQTLWYVRRRLGPWLVATDDFVELAADVQSDREQFLVAVREQRLRDAVGLYAGEFIPDFAAPGAAEFEEWADVERRRLRALFVGCSDTLGRQALGTGQFATAVELALAARDAAPLDFATWRLLLEALAAARDVVGCIAELEHLEALLAANELSPDEGLRAAMRAAKAVASGAATAGATGAGKAAGSSDTVADVTGFAPELIGREGEFRALLERWDAAREGRGGAVLVTGIAGLGKSRLLADLHARLRAARARAILIRANPGDRAVSAGFVAAVAEILAQRPGAKAISSESAGVLVALAPSLASHFPRAVPDASQGEDVARRRAGALLDLLRAVSEEAPLALLIDDLHWTDAESRRVLEAVAARIEAGRLLLVLATRPPLDQLGGFQVLRRIELARFDLARVVEFCTRIGELPSEPWAAELPVRLLSATQGVPLAIIEALQRLLETGALRLADHIWHCDHPARPFELLGDGMVLEARVRSLSPGARELVTLLATLGRPTPMAALELAYGGESGQPFELRVEELEHRGFVTRHATTLAVQHDEIADCVLAVADSDEARRAHHGAALVLRGLGPGERELRLAAEHAIAADEPTLGAEIAAEFIRRRQELGDGRSASALLDDVLNQRADPHVRAGALARLPLWRRFSRTARRLSAGAIVGLTAAGAWSATSASVEPATIVYLRLEGDSARYGRVTIDRSAAWDSDAPLEVEAIAYSELPVRFGESFRRLAVRIPGRGDWIAQHVFPGFGDDIAIVDERGVVTLPTPSPEDDGVLSLSPDGRAMLFATSRWTPATDRYQLARFTFADSALERLTHHASTHFTLPYWSPDGSRLAYVATPFEVLAPSSICVSSVDLEDTVCRPTELTAEAALLGWSDESHVIARVDGSAYRVMDVETGAVVSAPSHLSQLWLLPGTGLFSFRGSEARGERAHLRFARGSSLAASRPAQLHGRPVRAVAVAVDQRAEVDYVNAVDVLAPARGLPVDQTLALRLRAYGRDGNIRPAHAVRFWSLDDSIATVRDGVLRPRRTGVVRVVGTVGGWRSDTIAIPIVASTERSVATERWDAAWVTRWFAFGDPAPTVVTGPRGERSLNPNGDGSYSSGAFLRQPLNLTEGFGVEFRASLPFTPLYQWQSLGVAIEHSLPAAAFGDSLFPEKATPASAKNGCSASFGGDARVTRTFVRLIGADDQTLTLPIRESFYDGRWRTIRLQLFPDGRCGLAVDGLVAAIVPATQDLRNPGMLSLNGHSVQTTLRVGPISMWEGVRGDVDWQRALPSDIRP